MRNLIAPTYLSGTVVDNLDHLGFRSFTPHPYLHAWVQRYWIARQPRIPEQGFAEKLYPDGGTNINFRFLPNQLPEASFNAFQTLNTMEFRGSVDLLGIRFHPGGVFQLFGLDMPGLMGKVCNTNELDTDINNPRLPDSSDSIETMSAKVNLSRRQLERRFQQEVGLTMVYVKQLQRIKKARQLISINPARPLTDIAYETGFYDQAHFNRQFQKINQQTPGQYRDRKLALKAMPDKPGPSKKVSE